MMIPDKSIKEFLQQVHNAADIYVYIAKADLLSSPGNPLPPFPSFCSQITLCMTQSCHFFAIRNPLSFFLGRLLSRLDAAQFA